jgi:fucose 4-O-acetylase-like acetyltransferase
VPKRNMPFTHYGKNSLNVYLLHMFFVFSINWLFKEINLNALSMVITSVIVSAILTIVLSSNSIYRFMMPLTDFNKLFPLLSLNKKSP